MTSAIRSQSSAQAHGAPAQLYKPLDLIRISLTPRRPDRKQGPVDQVDVRIEVADAFPIVTLMSGRLDAFPHLPGPPCAADGNVPWKIDEPRVLQAAHSKSDVPIMPPACHSSPGARHVVLAGEFHGCCLALCILLCSQGIYRGINCA
jgi:hypothetical protein